MTPVPPGEAREDVREPRQAVCVGPVRPRRVRRSQELLGVVAAPGVGCCPCPRRSGRTRAAGRRAAASGGTPRARRRCGGMLRQRDVALAHQRSTRSAARAGTCSRPPARASTSSVTGPAASTDVRSTPRRSLTSGAGNTSSAAPRGVATVWRSVGPGRSSRRGRRGVAGGGAAVGCEGSAGGSGGGASATGLAEGVAATVTAAAMAGRTVVVTGGRRVVAVGRVGRVVRVVRVRGIALGRGRTATTRTRESSPPSARAPTCDTPTARASGWPAEGVHGRARTTGRQPRRMLTGDPR